MRARLAVSGLMLGLIVNSTAWAYPEFQQFLQKSSGRTTNCAMCHAHPDGPEGIKPGQIGYLSPEEMNQLNRARAAFEPGNTTQNPILNAFGNSIVNKLGKTRFLQIRLHPEELPAALGNDSDLDGDGVSDTEEMVAGTNPLDETHGPPLALLLVNLRRYWFHLLMMVLATVSGIYGLNQMLRGYEAMLRGRKYAAEGE